MHILLVLFFWRALTTHLEGDVTVRSWFPLQTHPLISLMSLFPSLRNQ